MRASAEDLEGGGDADWQKARAESEKDGPLVHHIEDRIMNPTDFSPLR